MWTDPSRLQFSPSKLPNPENKLAFRWSRNQVYGWLTGNQPVMAALAPVAVRDSRKLPGMLGVVRTLAKALLASSVARAIRPALAQALTGSRDWTRVFTSKLPLRSW